jgi:hypothetical protein
LPSIYKSRVPFSVSYKGKKSNRRGFVLRKDVAEIRLKIERR